MSKKEVYYKFIFPNNNFIRTPSVKALRDACPNNVIAYDQLTDELKHYIDEYIAKPKYYDVRNYHDNRVNDDAGFSLIVSTSPEVNNERYGCTKFTSTFNGVTKVVYCSLVVSSGNFFYNWNLPEEVLAKSGLRDTVVSSQFHSSWYMSSIERSEYIDAGYGKKEVGNEKIVFNPKDFKQDLTYAARGGIKFYVNYTDSNDNVYQHNQVIYEDINGNTFESPDVPPYNGTGRFYTKNTNIPVVRHRYESASKDSNFKVIVNGEQIDLTYVSQDGYYVDANDTIRLSARYTPETYDDLWEDLKRDFIDLEVTRRILYNYQNVPSSIYGTNNNIPNVVSGVGINTVLSFDRPQEYIDRSPMPIQYDLLRDALNDRDPYGDCETVLVMWVADGDPKNIEDGNIVGLRSLNWKQYAIPIFMRCYSKNGNVVTPNTSRFIIPYYKVNNSQYRYHIRRNDSYNPSSFKESLYLPGLIEYSRDYILTYQNSNYTTIDTLDVQKYLFSKFDDSALKALYARKTYTTSHAGGNLLQIYYIKVNSNDYEINTNVNPCISEVNSNDVFNPRLHLLKSNYKDKWDLEDNTTWEINSDWFIILFDKGESIEEVTGTLKLVGASALRNLFLTTLPSRNFDDIYLTSLGITPDLSIDEADSLNANSFNYPCLPIGFLDNHICINNVVYGSNTDQKKVVVGFKDVCDYTRSDRHHFHYNSNTDEYTLVTDNNYQYTAYVMNYVEDDIQCGSYDTEEFNVESPISGGSYDTDNFSVEDSISGGSYDTEEFSIVGNDTYNTNEFEVIVNLPSVGDIVTFGTYLQETNTPEPIEWRVLDVDTINNKVLLVSEKVLDCQPYNTSYTNVTWETCSLRAWLNSTFYNTAFSSSEKDRILTSLINNPDNPNYAVTQNSIGGNDTLDKVFCLSIQEALNTSYFSNKDEVKASGTQYAIDAGARSSNGYTLWWLRSSGSTNSDASMVYTDGEVQTDGFDVTSTFIGVRPVMWITY